jgi:hypothetical protein
MPTGFANVVVVTTKQKLSILTTVPGSSGEPSEHVTVAHTQTTIGGGGLVTQSDGPWRHWMSCRHSGQPSQHGHDGSETTARVPSILATPSTESALGMDQTAPPIGVAVFVKVAFEESVKFLAPSPVFRFVTVKLYGEPLAVASPE